MFERSSNNHRKFVELIFRNNRGKYANLDATTKIEAGDYGYVGKEGRFMKEGNIFTEGLVEGLERKTGARMGQIVLMSEGTRSLEVGPNIGVDIPGFLECGFKARFSFAGKAGAALILNNPVATVIDNQGRIKRLFKDGKLKKDRAVVTESFVCPSYALLLAGKEGGEGFIGLNTQLAGVSVPLGLGMQVGWVGSTSSGEWVWGHDPNNRDVYYPLCLLGGISPRIGVVDLRDSPMPPDDEADTLAPYPTPWDQLDEDGEEVVYVDKPDENSDDDESLLSASASSPL